MAVRCSCSSFVVCGVVGALAYLAFNWASPVPVVGASGAISGLMAAALRMLPGQTPWAVSDETPLAPLFSRQIAGVHRAVGGDQFAHRLYRLGLGGETAWSPGRRIWAGSLAGLLLSGPFDSLRPRNVGTPVDR